MVGIKLRRWVGGGLRHPLAMGSVLAGACAVFSVHPGALGDFMAAAGVLFLLNVLIGNYRLRTMSAGHWAALAFVALIVLFNLAASSGKLHERSLRYLLSVPGLIMACHSLAAELHRLRPDVAVRAAAVVLSACIGSQVLWLGWHRDLDPFGFYDNPHHLGLFASFALPLAGWLLFRLSGRLRALMPPVMLAAFYLLWQSGSRISWLVFFAAILLAAFLFMRRRQVVILLAGLGSTAVVTAWVSGFAAIIGRVEELWINRWTEERVFLWPATLRVLQRNSWREWLFGHGIGSFRFEFKEVIPEVPEIHQFAFPHNAVLQLVFENGIVGTLLFLIAFGLLMGVLLRLSRRLTAPGERYLAMVLFALLCIVAGHCLLTKSVYSKYILFSVGLIAGTTLVLVDQAGLIEKRIDDGNTR